MISDIKARLESYIASGQEFALCRLPDDENVFFAETGQFFARRFPDVPPTDTHKDYISGLSAVIDELRITGGKTVIARTIHGHISRGLADIAEDVFDANKHAFCLLARIDGLLWLAASPELLFDADIVTGRFKTMSLAGTRPRAFCSTQDWDAKNIDEQNMVTRYILSTLGDLSLKVDSCDTDTLISNNIMHICTSITGHGIDAKNVWSVMDTLSPTPALCGLPRDRALRHISMCEPESRYYYGGYFGLRMCDRVLAHVMLRCAAIDTGGDYRVYTGSGITAMSVPQDEWHETELKAAPLIEALTK